MVKLFAQIPLTAKLFGYLSIQLTGKGIAFTTNPFFVPQNCWNCGRKASETCSGCSAARYCGSFCQHKDWERHHLICSPGLQAQPQAVSTDTVSVVPDAGSSPDTENGGSRTSTPTCVPAAESNGH